jgi:hypothetical protein
MSWLGFLENILSNLFCLLSPIIIGWLVIYFFGRRRLLAFFGVNSSKRLFIYISNLRVQQFGAIGIDGHEHSYSGFAAPFGEMEYAINLRNLFIYLVPSLSQLPGILGKLLIYEIEVEICHSPDQEGLLDNVSSFIVLGSPAYNTAAAYVQQTLHSRAKFREGSIPKQEDISPRNETEHVTYSNQRESSFLQGTTVSISASPSKHSNTEAIQEPSAIIVEDVPPMTDPLYCFVERIIDSDSNRSVFYVAGLSEKSTMGSAHFLISNWSYLYRKYKTNTPFLIMLRVDTSDHAKSKVIFER